MCIPIYFLLGRPLEDTLFGKAPSLKFLCGPPVMNERKSKWSGREGRPSDINPLPPQALINHQPTNSQKTTRWPPPLSAVNEVDDESDMYSSISAILVSKETY